MGKAKKKVLGGGFVGYISRNNQDCFLMILEDKKECTCVEKIYPTILGNPFKLAQET